MTLSKPQRAKLSAIGDGQPVEYPLGRAGHALELFDLPPIVQHQSQLAPELNKFHAGNGEDGKHYWLTPPELYAELDAEFQFDFDPCPYPKPDGFDGLTCEWGQSNYVNPPFVSIIHQGKKKGPTAWVRKAIIEWRKGKRVVLVYPVDKWVLMLMDAILGDHAQVRNLCDVRWLATEDRSVGKGTGRHIACFILDPRMNELGARHLTDAGHGVLRGGEGE